MQAQKLDQAASLPPPKEAKKDVVNPGLATLHSIQRFEFRFQSSFIQKKDSHQEGQQRHKT